MTSRVILPVKTLGATTPGLQHTSWWKSNSLSKISMFSSGAQVPVTTSHFSWLLVHHLTSYNFSFIAIWVSELPSLVLYTNKQSLYTQNVCVAGFTESW